MAKKTFFILGAGILVMLAVAYFIPVNYTEIEAGIPVHVESILLGEVIFHNPFVLALYMLIAVVLMVKGWSLIHITYSAGLKIFTIFV